MLLASARVMRSLVTFYSKTTDHTSHTHHTHAHAHALTEKVIIYCTHTVLRRAAWPRHAVTMHACTRPERPANARDVCEKLAHTTSDATDQ